MTRLIDHQYSDKSLHTVELIRIENINFFGRRKKLESYEDSYATYPSESSFAKTGLKHKKSQKIRMTHTQKKGQENPEHQYLCCIEIYIHMDLFFKSRMASEGRL